jgi:hypothetical protein
LPKVLWGLGIVGGTITGIVFNGAVQTSVNEDARLKAEYIATGDPARSAEYQQALDANSSKAQRNQTLRNAAYILSGVCVVGFAVTFAF